MDKEKSEHKASVLNFPISAEVHFRLAAEAYQKGDMYSALNEAKLSLNAGEEHANCLLGLIYENVNIDGSRNYENALFYYEQGVRNVGALECWLGVARLHYLGLGVDKNFARAFECYSIIAEDSEHPIADLMLGKMYLDGEGVAQNDLMAMKYLRAAQSKGFIFAYTYLGTYYFHHKHYLKGVYYRVKAALNGLLLSLSKNGKQRLRRI